MRKAKRKNCAGVTQLVECNLAKVDVESSNLFSRSIDRVSPAPKSGAFCLPIHLVVQSWAKAVADAFRPEHWFEACQPRRFFMIPFFTRFRALAAEETRFITLQNHSTIPDGEYAFVELYCPDENCDCRRVMINVMGEHSGNKVWATLNYGWESVEFYANWCRDRKMAETMSGVFLDPLNAQTTHSPEFLRFFRQVITDTAYVERLKRHYQMFRPAKLNSKTRKNKLIR
jgi:hypothetical protein